MLPGGDFLKSGHAGQTKRDCSKGRGNSVLHVRLNKFTVLIARTFLPVLSNRLLLPIVR